jgi:hypothetical protein
VSGDQDDDMNAYKAAMGYKVPEKKKPKEPEPPI